MTQLDNSPLIEYGFSICMWERERERERELTPSNPGDLCAQESWDFCLWLKMYEEDLQIPRQSFKNHDSTAKTDREEEEEEEYAYK